MHRYYKQLHCDTIKRLAN